MQTASIFSTKTAFSRVSKRTPDYAETSDFIDTVSSSTSCYWSQSCLSSLVTRQNRHDRQLSKAVEYCLIVTSLFDSRPTYWQYLVIIILFYFYLSCVHEAFWYRAIKRKCMYRIEPRKCWLHKHCTYCSTHWTVLCSLYSSTVNRDASLPVNRWGYSTGNRTDSFKVSLASASPATLSKFTAAVLLLVINVAWIAACRLSLALSTTTSVLCGQTVVHWSMHIIVNNSSAKITQHRRVGRHTFRSTVQQIANF